MGRNAVVRWVLGASLALTLVIVVIWRWQAVSQAAQALSPSTHAPAQSALVAVAHQPPAKKKSESIAARIPDRSLGMGLAGVKDWSTEYPFLDLVKSARRWRSKTPLELDEDGWPKGLPPGQTAELYFLTIPDGVQPPWTRLVVRYEGKGKVSYKSAAQQDVSKSKPGRDIVDLDTSKRYAVLLLEASDPQNPIRNIRIVPEEHEAAFLKGAVFNPPWLERIGVFRTLRFMDWMETNNSTITSWSERPKLSDASWAENFHKLKTTHGVPAEVMVQLANQLKADAWFNMPHLADDNYIRQFAKLVKTQLSRDLYVYVEHSNEVWNWQFQQAQYANRTGRALWGDHGNAYMQWHGMKTARICEMWKSEFGAEAHRVKCVLGLQAHYEGLAAPALDCPLWVKADKTKPCYQHGLDAVAIAGYFSGCLNGKGADDSDHSEQVRSWASGGEAGMKRALEQAADSRHFACDNSVEALAKIFKRFDEIADERGLDLVAYEAGQHITGAGGPLAKDESIVDFHVALNRRPEMQALYRQLLQIWKSSGGGLLVHFVDVAPPSKHGSWGALEYLSQKPSPKWQALSAFTRQRCWWPGC